jgi:hypothetical protein
LEQDEVLLRLLDYDGRCYRLAQGWSLKFRIRPAPVTPERPHGVRYALTLHDAAMVRLLGFDNAHGVPRRQAFDHRHRFRRTAELVPYTYIDADQLLVGFFDAVAAACRSEGVPFIFDSDEVAIDDDMEDGDGDDITG